MRTRRWDVPEGPPPKHPYRDSALFHGVLALVIVGVATLTGGSPARALAIALGFFALATGWSWWRWRGRLADERRQREERLRRAGVAGE